MLDSQIEKALLTNSRIAQRAIAKGQSGILAALNGASADMIAVDEVTGDTVLAVAGLQVYVFSDGGKTLRGARDVTQINDAFLEGPLVRLDGLVGVAVTFQEPATAAKFATTLNKLIQACRPRSIPTLYPQYFLDLIKASGVQATVTNVLRLIERTAFATGFQGAVYCAQLKDPKALEELIRRFARGGPPDRQLQLVDDMVDWLWAWNPGCHKALVRQFDDWRERLLAPGSFLIPGTEIPPWGETPNDNDNTEAWRLGYAQNLR
jgi:hypothetical protein